MSETEAESWEEIWLMTGEDELDVVCVELENRARSY